MKLVGDRYAGMYDVSEHAHGAARFDHPLEFSGTREHRWKAPQEGLKKMSSSAKIPEAGSHRNSISREGFDAAEITVK